MGRIESPRYQSTTDSHHENFMGAETIRSIDTCTTKEEDEIEQEESF